MATKTVINTNQMPQAKKLGISIIIDQDQAPNLQLDQQQNQQQQTLTELGKTTTNDVEVSTKKQEMSPNSPTLIKKTFIDINRNNVLVNVHQEINDSQHNFNDDHQEIIETGFKKIIQNFPTTLGEREKLEKTEIAKINDNDVEILVGKSPIQLQNELTTKMRITNGTNNNNNNNNNIKKTIIKCNIEKNNANIQNDELTSTSDVVGAGEWHNEKSISIGVSNGNNNVDNNDDVVHDHGQVLCNGLRIIGIHSQKLLNDDVVGDGDGDVDSVLAVSRLMKAEDCASANVAEEKTTHVVKIQIKPNLKNQNLMKTDNKQITVVQVNEIDEQKNQVIEQNLEQEKISISKTELKLNLCKMVQKSLPLQPTQATINNNSITSGNTTVTELNVTNPNYLYYTMSSGQFSPCDTLDSGTGSDLESNGNTGTPMHHQQTTKSIIGINGSKNEVTNDSNTNTGGTPKLELHLKTTKIRINNGSSGDNGITTNKQNGEHQRAGSLTDSEESETSSLSCDSLHSTEYVRQLSASPSGKKSPKTPVSAFLPDSLLRDIRDRKFPTNDFETKYGNQAIIETITNTINNNENENSNDENVLKIAEEAAEHAKYLQACKVRENQEATLNGKRTSLPPGKTFIIDNDNGTFIDTKMNSMPRKYEADKYYNFHVNEHENFHSFSGHNSSSSNNNNTNGNATNLNDDEASLSEYDIKSINDDDFAGYKDIRCNSATSTIRSSKGTVRGVKNRVRNGIATFLQMQQPHVKNYLDKDLGKVVLYTTSMGIIRDTYAKCSNVKQILRTLLVKFEERDIFMSVEYQAEIKDRMHTEVIRVPQLFVEGQHIGDAETVERLNESGELRQLLKPYKSISTTYTCQTCGGYRLLPCPSCNGSKKSVHRNHFTAEFVALKCMNCDEVGLVKCHNC